MHSDTNAYTCMIPPTSCMQSLFNSVIITKSSNYLQAETRFREELDTINVTVASRTFRTDENPIETEDLFVSCQNFKI